MPAATDTIAAIATPPGTGGVGIIRISGQKSEEICQKITGTLPQPRFATFANFKDRDGNTIDQGLILRFPKPKSFTGQDVIELQGHGGPVLMQMLLDAVIDAGARPARPGEFSERAFLNDRMDLVQAEAVADLIESGSRSAARLAMRALEGDFSRAIHACAEQIENLRIFVEAAIDFPDEEIDFLEDSDLSDRCDEALLKLTRLIEQSRKGASLRSSLQVVLCGAPNAGKSSLLNALTRKSRAIVSDIPGTTRDTIDEHIDVGGVQLKLVDTAGIRSEADHLEQEGINRARSAMEQADLILLVHDTRQPDTVDTLKAQIPGSTPKLVIHNKIDQTGASAKLEQQQDTHIWLSAKTGEGIDVLENTLSEFALKEAGEENLYLSRARHLNHMNEALVSLKQAITQLNKGYGELMAEDLKASHKALGEIIGHTTSDDLLGKIFGSFCIGK